MLRIEYTNLCNIRRHFSALFIRKIDDVDGATSNVTNGDNVQIVMYKNFEWEIRCKMDFSSFPVDKQVVVVISNIIFFVAVFGQTRAFCLDGIYDQCNFDAQQLLLLMGKVFTSSFFGYVPSP